MIVWVNGALCEADQVRVCASDGGILSGVGAFETLRSYGGTPFAWDRHMARLSGAARALQIVPPDDAALRAAVDTVLRVNELGSARIRVTVVAGSPTPTAIVAATPLPLMPRTASVVVAPWSRDRGGPLAGIKSISNAANTLAASYATARGATDAVFTTHAGALCEAATANLFVVSGAQVITPPLSSGCLPGITRAVVLEICSRLGIPAFERDLAIPALFTAEEVFLTSSIREIHPVTAIEGCRRRAGALTSDIAAALRERISQDLA